MKVGYTLEMFCALTKDEVIDYTSACFDHNKIHYNEYYTKTTPFKKLIVPGLMTASLFGGLFSRLGDGTIHLGQTLKFIKPIFIDEEVKAEIELINIRQDKPIYTFKCTCYNSNAEIAIEGEAVVKINCLHPVEKQD